MDKVAIIFAPGCYGSFINWCIEYFSGSDVELPFNQNGNSHKRKGKFKFSNKFFIFDQSDEWLLSDYDDYDIIIGHPKTQEDTNLNEIILKILSTNRKIIFLNSTKHSILIHINNKFTKIWTEGFKILEKYDPMVFKNYNKSTEPLIDHEKWMQEALKEARQAMREEEVPVGAVVVFENRIIGRGHNQVETLQDPTAHAEMIAITSAAEKMGDWRLEDCVLYSTIEPCTMCAGAAVLSRIKMIVFGARDPKFGACGSIFEIPTDTRLNHRIDIISGVMEYETAELMQRFFKKIRTNKER